MGFLFWRLTTCVLLLAPRALRFQFLGFTLCPMPARRRRALPACLQVRSGPNCVGGCSLRFLLAPLTPCTLRLTVSFGGGHASNCIS